MKMKGDIKINIHALQIFAGLVYITKYEIRVRQGFQELSRVLLSCGTNVSGLYIEMSPLIFSEKVQTERIFMLLHITIQGSAVLQERFKLIQSHLNAV